MLTLEAGEAAVQIFPECGGRIGSLRVDGHELLLTEGDDALRWGCYPMAPYAGRVRGGRFAFEGADYELPLAMPPHAIHGTVLAAPFDVEASDPTSVRLRAELGPNWPFAGEVRTEISLAPEALRLSLKVHAEDAPFPASVGWHPWFRRVLDDGSRLQLQFEAKSMYERDASGIPTGRLVERPSGPVDDCFLDVTRGPSLEWPGALRMELTSSHAHWVLYDEPADSVCIEPQTGPPDALNLEPRIVQASDPMRLDFGLSWRKPAGS